MNTAGGPAAVDEARQQVAAAVNAHPTEVVLPAVAVKRIIYS
jgi:cysteine sulfinate desulfinase/cysteine desulfurase-like protein